MNGFDLWKLDPKKVPGPLGKVLKKEMHLWVGAWLADRARRQIEAQTRAEKGPRTRHILFSICDHYEPLHGNVDMTRGRDRVARWRTGYPKMAAEFRDATGRPPRHSYFFPGEQYDPALVEPLGELVEAGLGEVEVHLHHDGDTRATLKASLEKTLADLMQHGLISRDAQGKPAWAFIHGNWCLANARRDGRWCGVDDEMELLYELGCYCDLTFPSAPDQCQPGIVNAIYYPRGDVRRRRAYEDGERVHVGMGKRDRLLLIEGPIALSLRGSTRDGNGNGKRGRLRIESAALDASDPPDEARLATWLEQEVRVEGRPDWIFVKLHTHGAPEANAEVMLGKAIFDLHRALARHNDGLREKLHYVTAREMYNVARAAMDGAAGDPPDYFDYEVPPPPRAKR